MDDFIFLCGHFVAIKEFSFTRNIRENYRFTCTTSFLCLHFKQDMFSLHDNKIESLTCKKKHLCRELTEKI